MQNVLDGGGEGQVCYLPLKQSTAVNGKNKDLIWTVAESDVSCAALRQGKRFTIIPVSQSVPALLGACTK